MKFLKLKCQALKLAIASVVGILINSAVHASGYQFGTQSARNQGSANAGALEAVDATVLYYNPAGLAYLQGSNLSLDLAVVFPKSEFHYSQAYNGNIVTPTPVSNATRGGDYVKTTLVPHAYFAHQIDEKYTVGLGLFVPYGSAVNFDENFAGRYFTRSSELKSININPSLAIKLSPQHRVGLGISAQYMRAEIDKNYSMQTLAVNLCAQSLSCLNAAGLKAISALYANVPDTIAHTEGNVWGYGFNLGYIYEPNPATRLGIAYRSSIRSDFKGRTEFQVPALPGSNPLSASLATSLNAALKNADASLLIKTPESLALSVYHQTDGPWAYMADISYTRNSRLQQIAIVTPTPALPSRTLTLKTAWRDTYKVSVGSSYNWDDKTQLRAGYMYDQGANEQAQYALPTMPDSDRQWLSLGMSYRLNHQHTIDLAYSHVWLQRAQIARTDDDYVLSNGSPGKLSGDYQSSLNLLSLQWNYKF